MPLLCSCKVCRLQLFFGRSCQSYQPPCRLQDLGDRDPLADIAASRPDSRTRTCSKQRRAPRAGNPALEDHAVGHFERRLPWEDGVILVRGIPGPGIVAVDRLKALRGDLAGLFSIRVNDRWRIVFRWTENRPALVEVVDYH
ncbi:MAG: hypothetical protein HC897_06715 [Thermoanaerobaculia bacterium]|nr:hypothetical protein [Thermoanaerobaculia bacterium]